MLGTKRLKKPGAGGLADDEEVDALFGGELAERAGDVLRRQEESFQRSSPRCAKNAGANTQTKRKRFRSSG